jgi:CBS domain containing-hemolysin-like protein
MELPLLALLLVCSAFFSSAETALFSLTAYDREQMKKRSPRVSGAVERLLKDPSALLVTVLLANLIVNLSYFAVAGGLLLLSESAGVQGAIAASTVAGIIIFGETIPKAIAVRNPMLVTRIVALPMRSIAIATRPVQQALLAIALKIVPEVKRESTLSVEDLRLLLRLGAMRGDLSEIEQSLLRRAVGLHQRTVSELMIPRVDFVAAKWTASRGEVLELFRTHKRSQILLYEENYDTPRGLIEVRDLIFHPHEQPQALASPINYIPETKHCDAALHDMRMGGRRFAVCVDEYGGISGLVTIEILSEAIVGQNTEEFETLARPLETVQDGIYRMDGDLPLHDLEERLGASIPSDADTIGGFLIERLGRIPSTGDLVVYDRLRFVIQQVEANRVEQVWMSIDANSQTSATISGSRSAIEENDDGV